MKITVEHTDTFGGEANYSWCHRQVLTNQPDNLSGLAIVRRAKKAIGMSGVRCRLELDGGDEFAIVVIGSPIREKSVPLVVSSTHH